MTDYKLGVVGRVGTVLHVEQDDDLYLIAFDDFNGGHAGDHADPFACNMWWLCGYELERE